jgi:hypothetical protein
MPTLDKTWVIEDGDVKEYFLSGTFTAEKDKESEKSPDDHLWRGTLELPAVRVASPAAPDPILGLVAKLDATHGLWMNGVSPILNAPADAPVDKVLPEVFEKMTPPEGKIAKFDVIEQRDVTIPTVQDRKMGAQEQYIAVRVRTNIGEKIVLLQRGRSDWWSRIYDCK